jgi:glutamate-5-semialdehyde dehydrogenase
LFAAITLLRLENSPTHLRTPSYKSFPSACQAYDTRRTRQKLPIGSLRPKHVSKRLTAYSGFEMSRLRGLVEREAAEASRASSRLTDDGVAAALQRAAVAVRAARTAILRANERDCAAAAGTLDDGSFDRLRLDDRRIEALAAQVEAMAAVPPLAREAGSWTLPNGLQISERRIPIGTIGANFEARPNVALDVACQLLKSLNSAVLRTGGAALATVTVLVDDVLRPALEQAGLPAETVGLVRSPAREGARLLVSLPRLVPLVILRGSGETTALLERLAAENGVRTLAHAEGGGVLYVHAAASRERALTLVEASLDRLGVCNRLNLLLVDRGALALLPDLVSLLERLELEVRGTPAAVAAAGVVPLDVSLGHEWASDPERVRTVTLDIVEDLDDAARVANDETSGLAAGVVTEDPASAARFLDAYRGTTAFWHAPTRFADGFELTGSPETGINVDWAPGPRGPVTYRDLWLRQYRVVGDASQRR